MSDSNSSVLIIVHYKMKDFSNSNLLSRQTYSKGISTVVQILPLLV